MMATVACCAKTETDVEFNVEHPFMYYIRNTVDNIHVFKGRTTRI